MYKLLITCRFLLIFMGFESFFTKEVRCGMWTSHCGCLVWKVLCLCNRETLSMYQGGVCMKILWRPSKLSIPLDLEPKMVLKVDSSKAYDSLEWGFLEKVMTKLGWNGLSLFPIASLLYHALFRGEAKLWAIILLHEELVGRSTLFLSFSSFFWGII